jgi:hypothetical protein
VIQITAIALHPGHEVLRRLPDNTTAPPVGGLTRTASLQWLALTTGSPYAAHRHLRARHGVRQRLPRDRSLTADVQLLGRPPFTPHYAQSAGWALFPVGHQRPAVEVVVAAALRILREDEPADIAALVRVDRSSTTGISTNRNVTWEGKYPGIPVASAHQANVMTDIRTGITGSFAETMRRVIEMLPTAEVSWP